MFVVFEGATFGAAKLLIFLKNRKIGIISLNYENSTTRQMRHTLACSS